MNDTPLSITKRMGEMINRKTPAARLEMACSMFDSARELFMSELHTKNVSLSDAQVRTAWFTRLYGNYFSPREMKKIINGMPNMQTGI